MKKSVNVWYEHCDEDNRQNLPYCTFPMFRIAPH